jgi:exportin-7
LENSQQPYALYIAASALTSNVTRASAGLTAADRLQLRGFLLEFLFSNPSVASFVVQEVTKCIARVTKLSWFDADQSDEYPARSVVQDASKFWDKGQDHLQAGVMLLNQQVSEMNQPDSVRGLTKHRKVRLHAALPCCLQLFLPAFSLYIRYPSTHLTL